ncbi:MAG: hypothetical protein ACQESV_04550 [Thermodesulfobacteriota bacterium]
MRQVDVRLQRKSLPQVKNVLYIEPDWEFEITQEHGEEIDVRLQRKIG